MKENFESIKNEKIEILKSALDNEINKENVENIHFVIISINSYFSKAINSPDNKKEFEIALNRLINSESYLAEKYRETKEEREYLAKVNEAINYLNNLK